MTRPTAFHTIVLCAAALLLSTILLACGASDQTAPEPIVSVQTAIAKVQPIADVISAEGILYPVHQASISPKVTAPVRKFFVQRGDHVHRGQLLAVLDNHDLIAAALAAQGSYDQAKANYASTTSSALPEEIQTAKLNVQNATINLQAQQSLFDNEQNLYKEGAIARKQLDATQVTLTAARSAYQSAQKHLSNLESMGASQQRQAAKGQLEAAQGQYQAASAQLAYTMIRSPIAGVVADRAVYPGDVAPAGTPLLIVMDTAQVIARIHVPQSQAALLKIGDNATLRLPGITPTFPARVTVISPALDPNSTTVEVWVQTNNPKGELRPGAAVQASITADSLPHALVIPASAILTAENGDTTVMTVHSDDRAYSQPVQTGLREDGLVQIVRGLSPGAEVIVSGAYGLPEKTKVKPTPAPAMEVGSQAAGS